LVGIGRATPPSITHMVTHNHSAFGPKRRSVNWEGQRCCWGPQEVEWSGLLFFLRGSDASHSPHALLGACPSGWSRGRSWRWSTHSADQRLGCPWRHPRDTLLPCGCGSRTMCRTTKPSAADRWQSAACAMWPPYPQYWGSRFSWAAPCVGATYTCSCQTLHGTFVQLPRLSAVMCLGDAGVRPTKARSSSLQWHRHWSASPAKIPPTT